MKAVDAGEVPAAAAGGGRGGRGGTPPPAGGRGRGGMEQAQGEMPAAPMNGCPQTRAPRGRQDECVASPDGTLKAFYRNRNFWVANADGSNEVQVTTDGSVAARTKNGSGSWVYGEELGQVTAMWWSPDSRKVGFYRFDESQVIDFFLGMNQTGIQTCWTSRPIRSRARRIRSPKCSSTTSPTGSTTKIDVRDGKPFTDIPADGSVRERRRRSLRLQHPLVAGRRRAADEPHQPPAEHHGVRRVLAGDGEVPRRHQRRVAHRLGATTRRGSRGCAIASGSSGNRSGTAGRTTTSTT